MKRGFESYFPREGKFPRAPSRGRGPPRGGRFGPPFPGRGRGRFIEQVEQEEYHVPLFEDPDGLLPPATQLPEEPIVLQELPLKKQYASAIIGPRGAHVNRIRKETHVRLHVSSNFDAEGNQIVELQGTQDQILQAVELVRAYVRQVEEAAVVELSPIYSTILEVTPDMVGPVLGKGGATVKQIKQQTGTQIHVQDMQQGKTTQLITISGQLQSVKDAYGWVRHILVNYEPARRGPGRPNYLPPQEMLPPMEDSMRMQEPFLHNGIPPSRPRPRLMKDDGVPQVPMQTIIQPAPPANPMPAAQASSQPQILVLQPDGTYKAAQVLMMGPGQGTQPKAQPTVTQAQAPQVMTLPAAQNFTTTTLDSATLQAWLSSLAAQSTAGATGVVAGTQNPGVTLQGYQPQPQLQQALQQLPQLSQYTQPQQQQQQQQQPQQQQQYAQATYQQQQAPIQYVSSQGQILGGQQSGYATTGGWSANV